MDLCNSMPWNRCSEPECIFLTDEEEGQFCFDHKMALTWKKCSVTDCNLLSGTEEGQFCLVHRPEQGEHIIGNNMQKEEFIVKCDRCDFQTKGSKRGRLMKRLEKHQGVCKAERGLHKELRGQESQKSRHSGRQFPQIRS
jgi:hypothetical protein